MPDNLIMREDRGKGGGYCNEDFKEKDVMYSRLPIIGNLIIGNVNYHK